MDFAARSRASPAMKSSTPSASPTHFPGGLMAARLDRDALTAAVLRIDARRWPRIRLAFDRGARSAAGAWTLALLRGPTFTAAAELRAAPGSSH